MRFWWIPFLIAALLIVALFIGQQIDVQRFRNLISRNRQRYLDLVRKLERQTIVLNRMASSVAQSQDVFLWDQYEHALKLFENLLTLVGGMKAYELDQAVLSSAHFLQRDFESRIKLLENALTKKDGRQSEAKLWLRSFSKPFPLGCYFCSRPFIYSGLSKVRARVEGKTQSVYSCGFCKHELYHNKKVSILYFLKDEKPVHWSLVKEYNPVHDFWDLHRKNVVIQPTKLEIVYSRDQNDPIT